MRYGYIAAGPFFRAMSIFIGKQIKNKKIKKKELDKFIFLCYNNDCGRGVLAFLGVPMVYDMSTEDEIYEVYSQDIVRPSKVVLGRRGPLAFYAEARLKIKKLYRDLDINDMVLKLDDKVE